MMRTSAAAAATPRMTPRTLTRPSCPPRMTSLSADRDRCGSSTLWKCSSALRTQPDLRKTEANAPPRALVLQFHRVETLFAELKRYVGWSGAHEQALQQLRPSA